MPNVTVEVEDVDQTVKDLERVKKAAEQAAEAVRELNTALNAVNGPEYVLHTTEATNLDGVDWGLKTDA